VGLTLVRKTSKASGQSKVCPPWHILRNINFAAGLCTIFLAFGQFEKPIKPFKALSQILLQFSSFLFFLFLFFLAHKQTMGK